MLTTLYLIGTFLLTLCGLWLLLLTLASWFYRPRKNKQAPLLSMAVIVPAHNEEDGIVDSLNGIQSSDYPAGKLQLIVIADNCQDSTAERARDAGAMVFERHDLTQRGKGQALDWLLQGQRELLSKFDALTFVDADAIPDRRMFRELSATLSCADVQVVQGFYGVANPEQNWRTALTTVAFNVFNHLRMAGNSQLFGTAMLKGLGMAFRTELLLSLGWPAHSVVEDLELTLQLATRGIPIHYTPDAIITSDMAATREQADSQRSRWDGGRFQLAKQMTPTLLKGFFKGDWRLLSLAMDLWIPPLSLYLLLVALWTGFAVWMAASSLWIYAVLLLILFFYVISAQIQQRLPLKLWGYLCTAPLFVGWKTVLYLKMMVQRQPAGWVRTQRQSELGKAADEVKNEQH